MSCPPDSPELREAMRRLTEVCARQPISGRADERAPVATPESVRARSLVRRVIAAYRAAHATFRGN